MPRITSSVCDLHTGDCQCYKQANPAAQSLEELDFLKGACAAAQQGNAPKLQAILDRHPETIRNDNSSGGSGYTPLHYAARGGHAITVKLLLQRGTARNVHAQATGNVGPKAFFVQAGAEVSAQTGAGRATPLHRAAYMGHVDVVKLLIQHGANVELQDADGQTALHKAAAQGHMVVYEILSSVSPTAFSITSTKGETAADIMKLHKQM